MPLYFNVYRVLRTIFVFQTIIYVTRGIFPLNHAPHHTRFYDIDFGSDTSHVSHTRRSRDAGVATLAALLLRVVISRGRGRGTLTDIQGAGQAPHRPGVSRNACYPHGGSLNWSLVNCERIVKKGVVNAIVIPLKTQISSSD